MFKDPKYITYVDNMGAVMCPMTGEEVDKIVNDRAELYRKMNPILKKAVEEKTVRSTLRGEPVEPVFRKTSNFNLKPKQKV